MWPPVPPAITRSRGDVLKCPRLASPADSGCKPQGFADFAAFAETAKSCGIPPQRDVLAARRRRFAETAKSCGTPHHLAVFPVDPQKDSQGHAVGQDAGTAEAHQGQGQ